MIDGLRERSQQPLHDTARRPLFVAAMIVIAAAAAIALLHHHRRPALPSPPSAARVSPVSPSADLPVPARPPVRIAPPPARGSRSEVAAARRAARRFLAGYLPYSYGRRRASTITSATRGLRRRLAAQPPRVPPGERHRRPRVLVLQTDAVGWREAALRALVGDGAPRYTIQLRLQHQGAGWRVSDVGG